MRLDCYQRSVFDFAFTNRVNLKKYIPIHSFIRIFYCEISWKVNKCNANLRVRNLITFRLSTKFVRIFS